MPVTRMLDLGRLIDERGRLRVDRHGVGVADRAALVDRLADDVEDAAERHRADGDADLRAGVADLLAAGEALGRVHRDRADGVLAEVLRDFEDEAVAVVVGLERREDRRELVVEAHVDDRADHLADAADVVGRRGGRRLGRGLGCAGRCCLGCSGLLRRSLGLGSCGCHRSFLASDIVRACARWGLPRALRRPR